jgi:ABC-2 type transport system ATP-binding protein
MRQRLGIAQTLLHNPDLIVLDEPANGLDPQGQKEMRQLIQDINQEKKITVLISSHILNEIEMISNRMVIINKGKSVIEGEVNSLLSKDEMKVSFFVDDITKALSLISETQWNRLLFEFDQEKLVLNLSQNQIPEITKLFIQNEISVFAIKPLRSLEEYFLKITSG